ncbi:MAG: LysR family transcriptional regulator [Chloroflexi bacterium]|nr:LysR family transcriptional regulator [Chloroflexota bacterium]
MDLQQLRYFLGVAEQHHFTRAARELGVAQPSISRQIRVLEAELGTSLFHRMRGNVALTPAGEALLPWARRLIGDAATAADEVRELAGLRRGRLSVGATPSITVAILPAALSELRTTYPGIELKLREAGSRDLIGEVYEGTLDLALVILPVRHRSLCTVPLLREELVVAVTKDHPFARRDGLALTELRDVPLVMFREGYDLRETTLAACAAAGFDPHLAVEGAEMDGVLRMTAAGLGVAIVPSMVVTRAGPLHAVRLTRPRLARTIAFAYRKDRAPSRVTRELMDRLIALVSSRKWLDAMPAGLEVLVR